MMETKRRRNSGACCRYIRCGSDRYRGDSARGGGRPGANPSGPVVWNVHWRFAPAADWFAQCGIKNGRDGIDRVYWIPIYEILERRGFEVRVVKRSRCQARAGPQDRCQRCGVATALHEFGLLRGSFRPRVLSLPLRAYLRQRERLLDYAAAHIQHMAEALTQMNLQIHHVISDITGATGIASSAPCGGRA